MQRIPGFNAEASLYKTSEHYRMVGTLDTLEGERGVQPQAGRITCVGSGGSCIVTCGVEDESTGTSHTLGNYWIPGCYMA